MVVFVLRDRKALLSNIIREYIIVSPSSFFL